MADSQKINKELKLISNYIGLIIAKFVALAILIITFYPMRPTPAYIIASMIFCPPIIRYGLYNKSINDAVESFSLLPTAKKYRFTMHKYNSEKYSFTFTVLLLVAWQLAINRFNLYSSFLRKIPSVILMIYIPTQILVSIFSKIKIRYDFMHMNNLM